jgi:carbon-monoxide dehydrogenase small subunit
MDIQVTVNGERFALSVDPGDVLLETLRTRIGVKSPKVGCERGDCGSCTVLFDGHAVRSCLVLSVEADSHEVTTVEGLNDERYRRLEQSLLELNSFQCGFCAPGIVLAAAELLENHPHPSREDVQVAIGGNLCRCTGYEPIIDAVLAATGGEERPEQ